MLGQVSDGDTVEGPIAQFVLPGHKICFGVRKLEHAPQMAISDFVEECLWHNLGRPERDALQEFGDVNRLIENSPVQRTNVMLLHNLDHDHFMTLLSRCFATIRAHSGDGVCASVLESLALGIPVIASDDCSRPPGVITYETLNSADLCAKLTHLLENYEEFKKQLTRPKIGRNTDRMVELLSCA